MYTKFVNSCGLIPYTNYSCYHSPMDQEIANKFEEHEALLKKIYESAERTRKYILWSVIAGLLLFIIPLIGLMFVIPMYLKTLDLGNLGL